MLRNSIVFLCAVLLLFNAEFVKSEKFDSGGGHSYSSSGGLHGTSGHHDHPSSGVFNGSHSYPNNDANNAYLNTEALKNVYKPSTVFPLSTGNTGSHLSDTGLSDSNRSNIVINSTTVAEAHRQRSQGGHPRELHYYPNSDGLSGGGSNGYPSSAAWHSYPTGGGSHTYPNSADSYSYPRGGGNYTYSSAGNILYPSGRRSWNHTYPSNVGSYTSYPWHHNYPKPTNTTNIHRHYNYNPPQQIRYAPPHGGPTVSYPVYRGTPPTYVYQYKDSGSKYSSLLAGLALFNLGALAGVAVGNTELNYSTQPGELCLFGIKNGNRDAEETSIKCLLISSIIYAEQAKQQQQNSYTITDTTIIINSDNAQDESSYVMSPNNTATTLVKTSVTPNVGNRTLVPGPQSMASSATMITKIVNAVDVKGSPIELKPEMQCYVVRKTPSSTMKKTLFCGLLQAFVDQSLNTNSEFNEEIAITQSSANSGKGEFHYPLSWSGLPGGTLSYLNRGSSYSPSSHHHLCLTPEIRRGHGRGGRRRPRPTTYTHNYPSAIYRPQLCSKYQQESRYYQICVPQKYCYNPPEQIHYASVSDGPSMNYPIYRGPLPTYVYKYKDSGCKYSTLLAGLALLDLGVNIHAVCNESTETYLPVKNYRPHSNEVCLFGIQKHNKDNEEVRIDCLNLISGFIHAEQVKAYSQRNMLNSPSLSNSTVENATRKANVTPLYVLSTFNFSGWSNVGASISVRSTTPTITAESSDSSTTTNGENPMTKFVNATDVKGNPIDINAEMECYVKRIIFSNHVMKIEFPCGVLKAYVDESLKPTSAFDVNGTSPQTFIAGGRSHNYPYPLRGLSESHTYPPVSREYSDTTHKEPTR